jgi:hypothetical protein
MRGVRRRYSRGTEFFFARINNSRFSAPHLLFWFKMSDVVLIRLRFVNRNSACTFLNRYQVRTNSGVIEGASATV